MSCFVLPYYDVRNTLAYSTARVRQTQGETVIGETAQGETDCDRTDG